MNPIYFYAPTKEKRIILERNYKNSWEGEHSNFVAWIAQTYFHLKSYNFPCKITDRINQRGIVIADRDTLGNNYPFLPDTMLICTKSDREYHPSAHLHVVHNHQDFQKNSQSIWNSYFIPHWPIPNIIPRSEKRKDLVKNIAYIGSRSQLAEELKTTQWQDSLSNLGCNWLPIFEPSQWNHYTDIDVIVAARSFTKNQYTNKGFIKLLNCWHAGVPAILTPESSFMNIRKSNLDFIEINSFDDAVTAVKTLKENPKLYQSMIDNYHKRKEELTTEKVLEQWIDFWEYIIEDRYQEWQSTSLLRKKYLFYEKILALKMSRIKEHFLK